MTTPPSAAAAVPDEAEPAAAHDVADDAVPGVAGTGSRLARLGLTTTDGAVAGLAFVLCIAFGPTMAYPSWTPRMALVLLALPIGLLLLVADVRRGDRAAAWAAAFAAWILIAGVFSGDARGAIVGNVGRDLSAVLVVGAIALWTVGRRVSGRGRLAVGWATLTGLVLSLLVGVLQLVLDVRTGTFGMASGRPAGLTPNPVYFGGLMVGGVGLAATVGRAGRRPILASAALTALFAIGVTISGSRVAAGALVVVVVAAAVATRELWGALGAALGVAIGTILQNLVEGRGAVTRVVAEDGGLDGRLEVWRYSLDALAERPLFGWGFGRFQRSIQSEYTPDFVVQYAQEDLGVAWFDAHNIVVAIVNAIGPIGLLLAAAWVVVAARRATPSIAVFPAAVLVTWLLQPAALATLPIAALLFGVACRPPPDATERPRAGAAALALGVAACAYLVAADVVFYQVTESLDASQSEEVARLFPGDPVVAGLVAQVWSIETRDADHPRAMEWQRRAVDRDPDRPYWWYKLAERQFVAGDLDGAEESIDSAIELQPYHYASTRLRVALEVERGDRAAAEVAVEAACVVEAPECELDLDELMAGDR